VQPGSDRDRRPNAIAARAVMVGDVDRDRTRIRPPMTPAVRRLRSPLIALGLLALSANLAFAGHAGTTAGSATVDRPQATQGESSPDASAETETSEPAEATEPEAAESACPDIDLSTVTDLSSYSHGQIVCSAAHMDTPDGYANHGAWVSHWARGDHGAGSGAVDGPSHKGQGAANKP
jgi:cell pole-organizing protein PopZ